MDQALATIAQHGGTTVHGPDPVGDMMGQVEDPYAQPVEGEPGPPIVDGQPVPTPAPLPGNQPVIRPTSPQPAVKEAPRAEKKADADFF